MLGLAESRLKHCIRRSVHTHKNVNYEAHVDSEVTFTEVASALPMQHVGLVQTGLNRFLNARILYDYMPGGHFFSKPCESPQSWASPLSGLDSLPPCLT